MRTDITPQDARDFLASSNFHWYQHFALAPGVMTPGVAPVDFRLQLAGVPPRLDGKTVLDIGTSNGAICFEADRRGAAEVLGVDIVGSEFYGFNALAKFLGSRARYKVSDIYELPDRVAQPVDVVFCLGVLYHLRHPLLGLDALRAVTGEYALIETEISDWQSQDPTQPTARFYRGRELNNDGSNWFAPTIRCLMDWCWSAGFEPELLGTFPVEAPRRAIVRAVPVPGEPEYISISYDAPLKAARRARLLDVAGDAE